MGMEQDSGDALDAARSLIPILRKAYSGFGPGVEWLEKVLPKARREICGDSLKKVLTETAQDLFGARFYRRARPGCNLSED